MIATEILSVLGYPDAELGITLVSDKKIAELNEEYRNQGRPTDVLAFAMQEGDFGMMNPEVLGDVVISAETAKRQSEEYGHHLEVELCLLVIHGILHLFGYDHEQGGSEARTMRRKERELMEIIRGKNLVP